jgi:outer membrane protein OmpA-like peptidoglycan-associated protein
MKKLMKIAVAAALTVASSVSSAQFSNTLYFDRYNYRQHFLNPAYSPDQKFYVGFPSLGTIALEVGNNSIAFDDVFKNVSSPSGDRTVLFLDKAVNNGSDQFLDRLHRNLRLNGASRVNVLDFGFGVGEKGYVTFTVSARSEVNYFIPKKFFEVLLDGMTYNKVFNLDAGSITINTLAFAEVAGSYSRKIDDKLTVGGSIKYLHGIGGVKSKFKDLTFTGSGDEWVLKGDADLYAAFPTLTVSNKQREDGTLYLDDVNTDFDDDENDDTQYKKILKGTGRGFAIDLGGVYKLTDKLTLSGSLIDFGFVRFNKDYIRISKQRDFYYDGATYEMQDDDATLKFDEMEDDFENALVGDDGKKFNQWLTTKVYLGAEYNILKRLSFGFLSKTYFLNTHVWEDIALSVNMHPCRVVSANVTYNIFDRDWTNLGLGMNFNLYPFNLFVAVDNIPLHYADEKSSGAMIPSHVKGTTINFGFGIVGFSRNREKKNKGEDDIDEYVAPECEPDFYDADGDGVEDSLDKCANTPAKEPVDENGCPFDDDKDGVANYADNCPDTPDGAPVDEHGCLLDSDADGVPDYLDNCADTPEGVAVDEKGCPLDADKDGVPDYLDKCANTPSGAPVDATGCLLDSDGDGVADYLDKCPDVAGVASNNGCPEIKKEIKQLFRKALNGIQFQTGKSTILKSSYPLLDQIVNSMKQNPEYKLYIAGHTDNVGDKAKNLQLSKDRANAVKAYMEAKGIASDRISADGFGDEKPLVPNTTSANKAKNRRVEFEVEF